jgi:hypothetical protein
MGFIPFGTVVAKPVNSITERCANALQVLIASGFGQQLFGYCQHRLHTRRVTSVDFIDFTKVLEALDQAGDSARLFSGASHKTISNRDQNVSHFAIGDTVTGASVIVTPMWP